ncbi:MAG: winged helix-turn-helix transcriptional regulator [Candidatus Hodarchaeales archaeon]|jgi:transcription initiation factor IIE alpha subunit
MIEINRNVSETAKINLVRQSGDLTNLPKSALKIYDILETEGPMKSITISKKCNISLRTVRYQLSRLIERDIARRIPDLEDTRSNYYILIHSRNTLR